jgi:hypothetical protein
VKSFFVLLMLMIQFGNNSEKQKLFSIKDTAERCGVSVDVVYHWIKTGGLLVIQLPGTGKRPITMIKTEDLDDWIDNHRMDLSEQNKQDDESYFTLEGDGFFEEN